MARRGFNQQQLAYLRALPVVKSASETRIVYTDEFRRECMRRYKNGESAIQIFRDVGLDHRLIGRKRIERCVDRWRNQERDRQESRRGELLAYGDGDAVAEESATVRDALIVRQLMRIRELEDQVRELQAKVAELSTGAGSRPM